MRRPADLQCHRSPSTFVINIYLSMDIICHIPPLFLFRFCIWRGFKDKSDVCHVLCEELFMLDRGCTTFSYCRPHYFYLYEVGLRPPMNSSYIYEIRLIVDYVLFGVCHLLVPKSIIKCQTF